MCRPRFRGSLGRLIATVLLSVVLVCSPLAPAANSAERPTLVVLVAVDQLCYDYLVRFHDNLADDGLFLRVEREGAFYENCHHRHAFTYTGPGHSVMLTGAYPDTSGIIANEWFDRATGKSMYCVADPGVTTVGSLNNDEGVSPHNLLAPTVGDVLKLSTAGKSKVIGISIKDRGAVLMAGHSANAAYWMDARGNWVTSSYYRDDLPGYLRVLNEGNAAEQFAGRSWELLLDVQRYHNRDDFTGGMASGMSHTLPNASDSTYFKAMQASPYGNELTLLVAQEIATQEKLGLDDAPDVLAISLSSNDFVGHAYGPNSLEVEDLTYRTDRQLGDFVRFLEQHLDGRPWALAVTADHGVAPIPEQAKKLKLPAQRDPLGTIADVRQQLEALLHAELQPVDEARRFVMDVDTNQVFLTTVGDPDELRRARELVRDWFLAQPCVVAAETRDQLISGSSGGLLDAALHRSFNPRRSGDVLYVLAPYCIQGPAPATHGTPWQYDTHVPLLLLGSAIRPGRHQRDVSPAALAPTFARLLQIDPPAECVEKPLLDALKP